MVFSSYEFIFLFFPAIFLLYFFLTKYRKGDYAQWILVLASFFFYYLAAPDFFLFFVGSVFFNYLIGFILSKLKNSNKNYGTVIHRVVLIVGILENVILLGYFKYMDFFISNINNVTGSNVELLNIVLPIGISFFTFQLIAYVVDSYRGLTHDYMLRHYLLFITFFPQLIVGPIVHHNDVVPQYKNPVTLKINYKNIALAIFLFAVGCSKKIMLADPLTQYAQKGFAHAMEMTTVESWYASVSYTLSYYFDLSGYADMAIALGLFFNIKIPENFDSPYKARNFADYWRRWHITLSRFLGDYIFKNIFKKGNSSFKFYYAIFITFLVSGFWHGAGWNFIIWGVINGLFVIISHMMIRANKKLPDFLAWGITFFGVILLRTLFVANNSYEGFRVIGSLLNVFDPKISYFFYNKFNLQHTLYIVFGLAIVFFAPNSIALKKRFRPNLKYAVITALLLIISLLNMYEVGDFLYFQF